MKTLRTFLWLPLLAAPLGCGDDDGGAKGSGGDPGPVYVFMTQVYTADDRTVYLKLSDSLDVEQALLSIHDAHEFPSVANFSTIGGKLYVSSGESKTITDYEITPSLDWVEGVKLDFSNYPLDDNANFHYQYVLGEERVVLPFDVTSRLVWDPKQMRISETLEDTAIPFEKDGLRVSSDGNRSATRFADGPFRQPFHTLDVDDVYGGFSYIATYDDELREADVITAPCPALERVTLAEDGTTYFSSQWNAPFRHLFGIAPSPCAVRVRPDGTLDEAWTTDFTEQTGGRFVMNFRYLRDGKAIGNVLYHEELGLDFEGEYDSIVEDTLWEGGNVRAWMFDLERNTAKEIAGIAEPLTPVLQSEVVDDRIFIFVVDGAAERTKIYEVSDDAVATPKYEMAGDVYKLERLR